MIVNCVTTKTVTCLLNSNAVPFFLLGYGLWSNSWREGRPRWWIWRRIWNMQLQCWNLSTLMKPGRLATTREWCRDAEFPVLWLFWSCCSWQGHVNIHIAGLEALVSRTKWNGFGEVTCPLHFLCLQGANEFIWHGPYGKEVRWCKGCRALSSSLHVVSLSLGVGPVF